MNLSRHINVRLCPLITFTSAIFILFLLLNLLFPLNDAVEYSTIIEDSKGDVIHAFLTSDQKWRMYVELNEISPQLKKAIICKEDKYFMYHPGINLFAVFRAAATNLIRSKRTSGASTLTMQVARMLAPKERSYANKFIEVFRALQLEWKYSKMEILQLYLNLVPYGGNIEGVKSASVLYWGKSPDRLSLAEITTLSIIPNRPSSLRLGVNNHYIQQERNKWLIRFGKEKVFKQTEIDNAVYEPLAVTRLEAPKLAPHLSYKLKKLMHHKTLRTFLKTNVQMTAEKLVYDYVKSLSSLQIQNAAVIVIENSTQNVITYIGSADFRNKTDGGQVNGAAAIRQPGSALKPFIYGLCIDNGLLTPKTVIADVETDFGGYVPENYDNKFRGNVTAEFALENSLNIPAVKALQQLGSEIFIAKLKQCDFRQVGKDEKKLGLSLALGGCGVTLEEMGGLYASLANKGTYKPIRFVQQNSIHNKIQSASNPDSVNVLSKEAAFMITEILSKIARPDLPVNWESSSHLPRIAWKTGTSYGKRDAWSIGYNKKYTVAVWVGNFSGIGVPELNGANIATPLLFKIFNTIDYNSQNEWYEIPHSCGVRTVCSETGQLPNNHCTNLVTDYYIPLVSSNTICNNTQEITISADEKISYCKVCQPSSGYKKKLYKILSPEIQAYYRSNRIAFEQIPPHNPSCEKLAPNNGPVISSPTNNTIYYISKNEPQPLKLSCQTTHEVQKVYWYINDRLFANCKAGEGVFFTPENGRIKISCTDDLGRTSTIFVDAVVVDI